MRREGQRLHAHDSSRFDVLARLRVRLLLFAATTRTGPKSGRRAGASTCTSPRSRSSRPCLASALHSVLPLDDDRPLRAEEDGRRLRRAHGRWTMKWWIRGAMDAWDTQWLSSIAPQRWGRERGWSRNTGWVGAPPRGEARTGIGLQLLRASAEE
ncbi:hypothetical protein DFH08DRAFT_863248 [Mycena albidolilacea]|uniref:Uncharacterized protein n=1 Tax=Mycena albidolilacea TaxID=1033008 RepID=A0AAD7ETL6_9AGAR|nr:hypothetical protein DFH08DRAFT_863248 [Mycena albidolilacea]